MPNPYYFNSLQGGSLIIENKENESIIEDIIKHITTKDSLNICFLSSGYCRSEIYIIEYLILNDYKINKVIFFDTIYNNNDITKKIELVIELINNFYNTNIEYSFHTNHGTLLLEEFNNFLNDYPNLKNLKKYKLDLVISIHYQIVIFGNTIEDAKKEKIKYVNNVCNLKERIEYINFYYDDKNPIITTKILQYFNFNNKLDIKYDFFPISNNELQIKKQEIKSYKFTNS